MKIGYAQQFITPSLDHPVYLAGFGNNRRAETIHDDLSVRALSMHSAESTLVLCALDLIGFFRPDVQDVIRQVHNNHPGLQIVIASTHTHHGPDTMGLWGPDDKTRGVDADYMLNLKARILETVLASLSETPTALSTGLKPASVKTTSVHVPGLVKNARNPDILDDELSLLQFLAGDQKPLATIFNFPCHPEVLWEHNPHISADYPGYLRKEVERVTGAPCIFFSGALGGMLTPDVKDHSFEEAESMGKQLAAEGLKALQQTGLQSQPVKVSLQKKEVQVKLTNILYKVAFMRKLLPDVRTKGKITTEVNLIKVGDLWLATVPGEMLPKLGLALKASLKEAGAGVAGVIGLANDEVGYILPAEDFKYPLNPLNPGAHYEETNSISKAVGPKVMQAVLSLLE
jgi:hypothetical protein